MDFGLYSALRGTDDFATKRADAAMAMNIAQVRQQKAEQSLQQQMQMEEGMQSAFDAMANLDVLTEDGERIKALETESRKKIVQGVAKYGGDLKRYLASGGIKDMHEYKNNILGSEQYKNAMMNKVNLKAYMDDRSKDLFEKQTTVDVPVVDEKTGQTMIKPTKMSMAQQLQLFQQGKINRLNYAGAEKKVDVGIEDFNKMVKDPNNPYAADNIVTMSNVYEKVLAKGGSEEQARYQAQKYGEMVKAGGDSWKWNAGDKDKRNLEWAKFAEQKRQYNQTRADKKEAASGGGGIQRLNIIGNRKAYMQPNQVNPMSGPETKIWANALGFKPMEGKGQYGGLYKFNGDALSPDGKTVIPMADAEIVSQPEYFKGQDGKMYAKVVASFDDDSDAITDNGWFVDNLKSGLEKSFGNLDSDFWNLGMGGVRTGEVIIPIDHFIEDDQTREVMNKQLNVGNNTTNLPPNFGDNAEQQQGLQLEQEYQNYLHNKK